MLLKAHESLMEATDLLSAICNLRNDVCSLTENEESLPKVENSFVELGKVWQAPLYEITLHFHQCCKPSDDGGLYLNFLIIILEIYYRCHLQSCNCNSLKSSFLYSNLL